MRVQSIIILNLKKDSKAYILLFTCCVNGVVHLELVETVKI